MTEILDDVSRKANALGQAFKDNQSELHKLQSIQRDLESEFDDLVLQGNSLVAQLCVMEEERNRRQRNVKTLEKEINTTRQNYDAIRKTVLDKSYEYEQMNRKISEYVVKMKTYTEGMTKVESHTPLVEQVVKVKQDIQSLQSKKSELEKCRLKILTNEEEGIVMTKEQIQSGITEIKQHIEDRRDEYQDKTHRLESAQEKRKGLQMTNFILKKKNSALLTRMKRKIEDQKEKYLSFLAQKEYLLKTCETTHRKLEKFSEIP